MSVDYDDDDDTDREYDRDPDDEPRDPEICVLGSACLNPHPYHFASECFDLEMAQAAMDDDLPLDSIDSDAPRSQS